MKPLGVKVETGAAFRRLQVPGKCRKGDEQQVGVASGIGEGHLDQWTD